VVEEVLMPDGRLTVLPWVQKSPSQAVRCTEWLTTVCRLKRCLAGWKISYSVPSDVSNWHEHREPLEAGDDLEAAKAEADQILVRMGWTVLENTHTKEAEMSKDKTTVEAAKATGEALLVAGTHAGKMVLGAEAAELIGVAAEKSLGGMLRTKFPSLDEDTVAELAKYLAPTVLFFACQRFPAIPQRKALAAAAEYAMEAQFFMLLMPLAAQLRTELLPIAALGEDILASAEAEAEANDD